MELSQRVVLVTGGATGIGFEIAKQLKGQGNDVLICGRRAEMIDNALRSIPGLRGVACDIGRDDGICHLLDYLREQELNIDVLVNNAAVQVQMDMTREEEGSLTALDEEIRINLLAPIKLTKLLLPSLLARSGAAILNIVSLLALMPKPNAPGYCASKAGLYAFSRSLRILLKETQVKVFVAFPPLVDTPMTQGRGSNKMSADAFVREMLRQMAADRPEIRVGHARTLLALNRVAPGLAEWLTRRISAGRLQTSDSANPHSAR